MEQKRYLIDTNAVIDYLGSKITDTGMNFMNIVIDETPILSIVTKIEVLGFNAPVEHYQLLTDFMNDSIILDLTNEIVDTCIQLRKNNKIKLPDAIIAATALVNNLVLISRNIADFKNIKNLEVLNPHTL